MRRLQRREADTQFARFWDAFPRRVSKQDALKAWDQIHPSVELVDQMLAALVWQKHQPAWIKDGGAYVPYPATWLRGARWEDEPFHTPSPSKRTEQIHHATREFLK